MLKKSSYLLGLLIIIALLWNTWVIYPLKLLVVFFHELSHGLAAILTGGEIARIEVVAQQGGVCYTRGGSRFLTLTAGYLGSLIWGGIIFYIASSTKKDKTVMLILGILVEIVTVLYLRNSFGFFFGVATGAFMILSAKKLPDTFNDFSLRLIGLTSMVYAPLDIFDDTLARSHLPSDAHMLAQEIGGTTMLWGSIWIIISCIVAFWFVKMSLKHEVGVDDEVVESSI